MPRGFSVVRRARGVAACSAVARELANARQYLARAARAIAAAGLANVWLAQAPRTLLLAGSCGLALLAAIDPRERARAAPPVCLRRGGAAVAGRRSRARPCSGVGTGWRAGSRRPARRCRTWSRLGTSTTSSRRSFAHSRARRSCACALLRCLAEPSERALTRARVRRARRRAPRRGWRRDAPAWRALRRRMRDRPGRA